jgi:hypothetical protein
MAIEYKYGRVTLEHSSIGEDEPVVVFRAQDTLLPLLLVEYERLCQAAGSPVTHLNRVVDTRHKISMWQDENRTKVPD